MNLKIGKISPVILIIGGLFYIADMLDVFFLGLFCGLLHECGHLIFMRLTKSKGITLSFLPHGLEIKKGEGKLSSYKDDMLVALGGPIMSLSLFIIFAFLWHLYPQNLWFSYLSGINLIFLLFNLLPSLTCDGGRALCFFLLTKKDYLEVTNIMERISILTAVSVIALGLFIVFLTGYNITLFLTGCYLLFAVKSGRTKTC